MRIRLAAFAVAALLAPAIVQAADLTPVDFVNRHLAAAGKGDVGFVSWEAGPVKGADSFLIHDGKIVAQAVFIGEAVPQ